MPTSPKRRASRELQPEPRPDKLIFLDETWAKTNMTRLYGRAPRGMRPIGAAPFGHWNTTSFVAGLRHDGIVAPMVLSGAMNGCAFKAWVEQSLAPTLTAGDLVVADNLGSHEVTGVRETIEARGAHLHQETGRRCGRPSASRSAASAPTSAHATSVAAATDTLCETENIGRGRPS